MEHFCTCPVAACPRHSSNHTGGCDPCIKDNLEKKKMPACMFKVVHDDVSQVADYTIQGFVEFYLANNHQRATRESPGTPLPDYPCTELAGALRAIDSMIQKCEKAQEKFPAGNAHHTLLRNRLSAMYLSKALIEQTLSCTAPPAMPQQGEPAQLLSDLALLHTTELGAARIRQNLRLDAQDVAGWCRERIAAPDSRITRRGKNWYIAVDGCEITVNATSHTIITAHRQRKKHDG